VKWGNNAPRREVKSVWGNFLTQQAKAAAVGEIHRVFVGSMMDIFEKPMHVTNSDGAAMNYKTDVLRRRFFEEIVPNCPNLLFLLLTKRPSNINRMIPQEWHNNPPKNVMFGASVVDDKTAVSVHRQLSKVSGLKFYSVEPQLEFIDFSKKWLLDGIDWLIQGGESGPKKRPFDTDWARHTRDVCAQLNVPYFFKQIDKIQPIPSDLHIRQFSQHHG
jgi:protein gp37